MPPTTKTRRRVAITVGAAVLVSGVLGVLACIWRPDRIAALTLIPPWCFLFAGSAGSLLMWRLEGRRIGLVALGLWFLFAAGWVEEARSIPRLLVRPQKSRNVAGRESVRIVSLNCAASARCLVDLKPLNPDIVLLQEIPGEREMIDLAVKLFGSAGRCLTGGDTAILTRGSLDPGFVSRTAHFTSAIVTLDKLPPIECVSLRLDPPPSRLDFWTGKFWLDHRELRETHRRQLLDVIEKLIGQDSATPLVVGGDFNTTPLDRALDELRPRLRDAFDSAGAGWGATGTNDWPLFRVDQVWTNAKLDPVGVRARTTTSSDHRLVICNVLVDQQ